MQVAPFDCDSFMGFPSFIKRRRAILPRLGEIRFQLTPATYVGANFEWCQESLIWRKQLFGNVRWVAVAVTSIEDPLSHANLLLVASCESLECAL